MNPTEYQQIINLITGISSLGVPGVLIFVWWWNDKKLNVIMSKYDAHMDELREIYKESAKLNSQFYELAKDQKEMLVLSTQVLQQIKEDIRNNNFCPMARYEKEYKN